MGVFTTIAGSALLGTVANGALAAGATSLATGALGGSPSAQRAAGTAAGAAVGGFSGFQGVSAASDSGRGNYRPPEARNEEEEEHEAYRDARLWKDALSSVEVA